MGREEMTPTERERKSQEYAEWFVGNVYKPGPDKELVLKFLNQLWQAGWDARDAEVLELEKDLIGRGELIAELQRETERLRAELVGMEHANGCAWQAIERLKAELPRYQVYGTDGCKNCVTGRITLYHRGCWCIGCQLKKPDSATQRESEGAGGV